MRNPIILLLLLSSAAVRAEMTCEQYGSIAQQTIQLRDQGASLARLLADLDKGDLKQRLTAYELNVVKDVIRHSFSGALSPMEVVEACKLGGTLVPAR